MKNGKIFGRIHIADILIAALIVILVFGAVQFAVPREVSARTGDLMIRYTIEFGERVGEDGRRRLSAAGFHENVIIGEPVFDGIMGQHIGYIVDVYALPFQVDTFNEETGTILRAEVDGLEYTYIVIEASASVGIYETLIGNFSVGVGRPAFIRSRRFAGEGFIIAVDKGWQDD